MSDFPTTTYTEAQKKWIGKNCIVTPTVTNALDQTQLVKSKRVLDIGCGRGHYSEMMLNWGATAVHGIDSSASMIEICAESYGSVPGLTFEHTSITTYQTPDKFDVAVAFFVFQFIHDRDTLRQALKSAYQSLTPAGILVGIVPNGCDEFNPTVDEGHKFGAAVELQGARHDGQILSINFYEQKEVVGSAKIALHYRSTYEKLLQEVGFSKIEWQSPVISEEGLQAYGSEFFHSYLNPPKDIVFKAYK